MIRRAGRHRARDLGYRSDIAALDREADEVGAMLQGLREKVLGR